MATAAGASSTPRMSSVLHTLLACFPARLPLFGFPLPLLFNGSLCHEPISECKLVCIYFLLANSFHSDPSTWHSPTSFLLPSVLRESRYLLWPLKRVRS